MEFLAETSAGPLELEVTQLSGGTLVRLASTGDTWNSTYTPVPLSSFLVEFADLPAAEAQKISDRVLADWAASGEGSGPSRKGPKVAAAALPMVTLVVLVVLTLAALGVLVYLFVRSLLGA